MAIHHVFARLSAYILRQISSFLVIISFKYIYNNTARLLLYTRRSIIQRNNNNSLLIIILILYISIVATFVLYLPGLV